MCTLHDFLNSKIRCIHTSTVTGSHSCSGKNYAYASRTSCFRRIHPKISIYSRLSNTMYTTRHTKLRFKIIFEEDSRTAAITYLYYSLSTSRISLDYSNIYIYFLRESSRKLYFKTHQIAQLTRNLGSILQCPYIHRGTKQTIHVHF